MSGADRIMERIGQTTLNFVLGIIMVLNIGSWLVGAIWLALLGKWGILLTGLGLSIVMPWAYSIVLIPTMLLMGWMTIAIEKKQKLLVKLLIFISTVYQYAILMFWVLYVFNWSLGYYPEVSMIPLILYGYSTMTAPLSYMGQKEGPDASGSYLAIFIAEVAFLVVLVLTIFGVSRGSINNLLWVGIIGFAIYMSSLLGTMTESGQDTKELVEEGEVVRELVCDRCLKEVKPTASFCNHCGHKLI